MASQPNELRLHVEQLKACSHDTKWAGLSGLNRASFECANNLDRLNKLHDEIGCIIVEAGAIDHLRAAVCSDDIKHREYACRLTGNFLSHDTFRAAAINHGGIVTAMVRQMDIPALQSIALGAVCNLSNPSAGAKAAAEAGAIPRLVKYLDDTSDKAAIAMAIRILCRMTYTSTRFRKAAAHAGLFKHLPRIIISGRTTELSTAAMTLFTCLSSVPLSNLPSAQAKQCVKTIAHQMQHADEADRIEAILALKDVLATGSIQDLSKELRDDLYSLVDMLVDILGRSSTTEQVASCALYVLFCLAVASPEWCVLIRLAGAREHVPRWQQRSDATPKLKQNAERLLQLLEKHARALESANYALLGMPFQVAQRTMDPDEFAAATDAAFEVGRSAHRAIAVSMPGVVMDRNPECAACGAASKPGGGELLRCSACSKVRYCSAACQRKHWKAHKPHCHVFA